MIVEIRHGHDTQSAPCGRVYAPTTVTFHRLVPALLDCLDFIEDGHWWRFYVRPQRTAPPRTAPPWSGRVLVPCEQVAETRHLLLPSPEWPSGHASGYDAVDPDDTPVTAVLPHSGDECYWLFDMGESLLFRLRFVDAAVVSRATGEAVAAVRQAFGDGREMPAAGPGPVVVHPLAGMRPQYPQED